ncbi:MAG: PEP-CTERM sorting domain-containing protein [Verrucomicrobiota bacterium]
MKRSATHKAAALAGSAAVLGGTGATAGAAVVPLNNVPSPTVSSGGTTFFNWDVDGNGLDDFRLRIVPGPGSTYYGVLTLFSGNTTEVGNPRLVQASGALSLVPNLFSGINTFEIGPTLPPGYTFGNIGQSFRLTTHSTVFLAGKRGLNFPSGNFPGPKNIIGFSFENGTDIHYAWMQLELGSLTVISGAYNDTPGASILVGQVPEPSGVLLLAVGAAGLMAWRRRY